MTLGLNKHVEMIETIFEGKLSCPKWPKIIIWNFSEIWHDLNCQFPSIKDYVISSVIVKWYGLIKSSINLVNLNYSLRTQYIFINYGDGLIRVFKDAGKTGRTGI